MLISVITVNLNNHAGLLKTLSSVESQEFKDYEHIVIDGGSTDGSIELLYNCGAVTWISERDSGVYAAMNKGISISTGDWLLYLNSGDRFSDNETLGVLASSASCMGADVIYGDVVIDLPGRPMIKTDFRRGVIHHQGVLYRRTLHLSAGAYPENPKLTAGDYLFFRLAEDHIFHRIGHTVAVVEPGGISSRPSHYYQKLSIDWLFGLISYRQLQRKLLFHPVIQLVKVLVPTRFYYRVRALLTKE